ncbi:MAG TPA: glycosyltransferase [Nitrospirae bacterium]|nr:glycosyl transferase family 2 [bacterium BMS3Abin06]HDH12865.1 glycosyltransferase [Nitrospirota bacterium]HDZ00473.1 glycosyltransferase [Nitrospirota bacterium]
MSVILREEVIQRLGEIGEADILVGIPSFNNADSIGHVVRAVQAGVAKYFPDKKAILINSDGGSGDGTREVVERVIIDDFQPLLINQRQDLLSKIVTPYHGIAGKGSAFRTVFQIAKELNVKACAVVDSDLRSITPEWIELLIRPVLERNFDFVAPYYLRHKYDGTITNSIVYPVTRALYGKRIRQPIGGDFGFSGKLAEFYLTRDVWDTDVARFGIDIWMTTTAVANNFKVCQSFLGAKIHSPKEPSSDLSAMLMQVVSALFNLMEEYPGQWKEVKSTSPVPLFGFQFSVGLEPVKVNIERMINMFKLGMTELGDLWKVILSTESLSGLQETAKTEPFSFGDDLWARVIYDYALAWHGKVMKGEHMLKTLTPLYLGKVASLVIEMADTTAGKVEERIEALCIAFEKLKPYLIDKWE